MVQPNGAIRWIWDRGFRIKDESEQVYRVCGIGEDITRRLSAEQAGKRAEEEIKKYRDHLEELVEKRS